jgi:hypothetical protein
MTTGQTNTPDLNAHMLFCAQHQPNTRNAHLDSAGVASFAIVNPNQPFQAGLVTYEHVYSFTAQEE